MTLDPETLERIAQFIASLPSEHLFQPNWTPAQIEEWHKFKKTQWLMAEAWRARFLIEHYYPIDEALERKEISKDKAELIELNVKEYRARWELCQRAEKYLQQAYFRLQQLENDVRKFPQPIVRVWEKFWGEIVHQDYPFKSAEDLWKETLRADVDGAFSVCLLPYYDVPLKKWRQASRSFVSLLEESQSDGIYRDLSPGEVQTLKRHLVWAKVGFSWLGLMLLTCRWAARKDPQLRKALIAYNQSYKDVLNRAVKASRKVRGFAWNKGELLQAVGAGGVYR